MLLRMPPDVHMSVDIVADAVIDACAGRWSMEG